MKIEYKTGNLLEADEPYIAQGCNAQGVMGSGVAKLIRDRHERVFTEYRHVYEKQGNFLDLGQVISVECPDHTYLNCITQQFYGRKPDVVYVSYDGLRTAIRNIEHMVDGKSVAFPLIGAGLANGSWKIISQIIEEEAKTFQPVVYLLDGIIPDGVKEAVL